MDEGDCWGECDNRKQRKCENEWRERVCVCVSERKRERERERGGSSLELG